MKRIAPKLIGITGATVTDSIDKKSPFHGVRQNYIHLIEKTGGIPILLINTTNKKILSIYADMLDGLLITGGGDVHPKYYSKRKHALTGKLNMTIDEGRDRTELFLVREFYRQKKPILGICRGAQIINVSFGGTLMQHVPELSKENQEQHLVPMKKGGWHIMAHKVIVDPKSRLFEIVKKSVFFVNSAHHQMIDKSGMHLTISAQSPEGINEAIEAADKKNFIIGAQWHPEQMPEHIITKRIFKAFLAAA